MRLRLRLKRELEVSSLELLLRPVKKLILEEYLKLFWSLRKTNA